MAAEKTMNWQQWHLSVDPDQVLGLPPGSEGQAWTPGAADHQAAWELYTEFRTRISTQALGYRDGDEETALDSLYKLFQFTRDAIEKNGPACRHFATIAVHVLNTDIRPLTARWHKKKTEGGLLNDDDRRLFRRELTQVQGKLRVFSNLLGGLAEGADFIPGPTDDAGEQKYEMGDPIPFDRLLLVADADPAPEVHGGARMLSDEQQAIAARRGTDTGTDTDTDTGTDTGTGPESAPNGAGSDEHPAPTPNNLSGLACSGGGIRSATFCLGVAQALYRRGVLADLDYLSTVSGGGYFGSFLSSFLNDPRRDAIGLTAGRDPDRLPFAQQGAAEPAPIRQLRNNSRYLLKGGILGQARMAGLLLLGILVNVMTLLPLILLVLAAFEVNRISGHSPAALHASIGQALAWSCAGIGLMVLFLPLVYRRPRSKAASVARYERWTIGLVIGVAALWVIAWLLPGVYLEARTLVPKPSDLMLLFTTLPLLMIVAALVIGMGNIIGRLLIVLAGLFGPALLLLVSFACYDWLIARGWSDGTLVCALVIAALATLGWLYLINANTVTPHRYYRNRLAETYLLRHGETEAVDPQPLSALGGANPTAPYHLLNAAVNLPNSKLPELRGRDSDFFLFSRHACGSPLLGYRPTTTLEAADPHLDLGTAMSISGAAASSYMGTQTPKSLSFWLAMLNVRLAYWLPNPAALSAVAKPMTPRPFTLLWRELFGFLDESLPFVNLSDGGHIENLGIYELLRRRCKNIVAIDGEADPDMRFNGLMQLIRFARIDFDIEIDIDLGDLAKNGAGNSKAHFALGTIRYPQGPDDDDENGAGTKLTGYLLYIKSSVTGNEREYIEDYRNRHPSFPHESTADQFFTEAQFEAYRALGEHVGDELFREDLIAGRRPSDLASWFQALAGKLL